ncbi:hypothetical protein EJ06DRAFT_518632 [Trichodelitschia bisporula]|uniref:Uncharacterized protein n=1 Tax=Trichodelitschia bisporula TaxID=703511 RepID=A0A6G1I7Z5_9PEZI|nr:hypothetical protein EJ06DRAFT_518632 [Trichodelitschia bisporula]
MAVAMPSTGDILMLSQAAWRTARAFAPGRKTYPEDFLEVEKELASLSKLLKQLAEDLFEEDVESIVVQSDDHTQRSISALMDAIKVALADLESLVEECQITRMTPTPMGYTVERCWSDPVLQCYNTMRWTSDGGGIQHLKGAFAFYADALTVMRQALAARSLSRFEAAIEPLAEQIQDMKLGTPAGPSTPVYMPDPGPFRTPSGYEDAASSNVRSSMASTSSHKSKEKQSPTAVAAELPNDPEVGAADRKASTASQQDMFEKELFKNSAIYCDLRGKSVNFVKTALPLSGKKDTVEEVAGDCRILLVRRRDAFQGGDIRFTTSIWVFDELRSVRMQHKLPDNEDVIPYTSFFQSEKVSFTIPTELLFHSDIYGEPPLRTQPTMWINYVLDDVPGAVNLQNTVFGRSLIGSFKTEKTLRVHKGLAGVTTYKEQMCAMENFRVWQDDRNGAVFGMIHYSGQFRNGYLTFNLNDSNHPLRVKDEGTPRSLKIKGLRIPADVPSENVDSEAVPTGTKSGKEDEKRFITAVRIEFTDYREKARFTALCNEISQRMVQLTTD